MPRALPSRHFLRCRRDESPRATRKATDGAGSRRRDRGLQPQIGATDGMPTAKVDATAIGAGQIHALVVALNGARSCASGPRPRRTTIQGVPATGANARILGAIECAPAFGYRAADESYASPQGRQTCAIACS